MTDDTKAYKPWPRKSEGLFSDDLLDQLPAQVRGYDADSLPGESGLVGQLKEQLPERMPSAEPNHHLATERASGDDQRRSRHQAALPRLGQHQHEVEHAPALLEGSGQSGRDYVRLEAMNIMCV